MIKNMDTYSDNREDRYYKFSPTIVDGFIVNHTDNINYDICFDFDNEIKCRYDMVHKEKFTYIDTNIVDNNIKYDTKDGIRATVTPKEGTCYRCRLKKIDVVKPQPDILKEVHSLIHYNDGWVLCVVSDVDIYYRLLVEIYDIDKNYSINDILLDKYPNYFKIYPDENSYNRFRKSRDFSHPNIRSASNFSWKKY